MGPAEDTPEGTPPDSMGTLSEETQLVSAESGRSDRVERRYLLVFSGASSWMHQLPASGSIVIGRSETADLRIDSPSVSRSHARLDIGEASIKLVDLGSQNGTFVNEKRITGEVELHPGDAVTIHKATMILHSTGSANAPAAVLLPFAFRQRLEDEIDRAVRYDRAFSVLCLLWPERVVDCGHIERVVTTQLRRIDAVAWAGDAEFHVLLAETSEGDAGSVAKRLQSKLGDHAGEVRIGRATCSAGGFDAEGLLATARNAASGAAKGDVAATSREYQAMTIAGQRVLIADPAVVRLYALIERLAPVDLPILITGETGCGKELAATAIHMMSRRANKQLVSLNCAAIQETLVESELFGHERGAFSGAVAAKPGLLEAATGSTLLLDEIGELALGTQAKLLRVLETRKMTRVGDVREREVDVRIVAATNRDLEAEVSAGRFRQDLYFRLSGATLRLPPLRERRRELPLLANAFLEEACTRAGRPPMTISEGSMKVLLEHSWPGNIRELKNLMHYVAAAHRVDVLTAEHVAERLSRGRRDSEPALPLEAPSDAAVAAFRPIADEIRELEMARIRGALEATGGNQTKAAALLSMPVRTFFDKVKQYGLQPKKK